MRGSDGETRVRIYMVNSKQTAVATIQTPGGVPTYEGDARIDGVPGTAAPIPLILPDTAGSICGALLPTGRAVDVIDGVAVTLIDNGMPVVVMRAADLGRTGYESREALDADTELKARIEAIRLKAGPLMNLGDVDGQVRAEDDAGRAAPRRRRDLARAPSSRTAPTPRSACSPRVSVATACLLPERLGARPRQDSRRPHQAHAGRAPDRREPRLHHGR